MNALLALSLFQYSTGMLLHRSWPDVDSLRLIHATWEKEDDAVFFNDFSWKSV